MDFHCMLNPRRMGENTTESSLFCHSASVCIHLISSPCGPHHHTFIPVPSSRHLIFSFHGSPPARRKNIHLVQIAVHEHSVHHQMQLSLPNIVRSNTSPVPSPLPPCHHPAPPRCSLRNYPHTRNCPPPCCDDYSRGSTCWMRRDR